MFSVFIFLYVYYINKYMSFPPAPQPEPPSVGDDAPTGEVPPVDPPTGVTPDEQTGGKRRRKTLKRRLTYKRRFSRKRKTHKRNITRRRKLHRHHK